MIKNISKYVGKSFICRENIKSNLIYLIWRKKIKFIVDKNSTISYGNGKYIMIVEEGKGYDTVLDMFFLEECEIIGTTS
jgi:hypothetical protein